MADWQNGKMKKVKKNEINIGSRSELVASDALKNALHALF
jgi:hypothetical protein